MTGGHAHRIVRIRFYQGHWWFLCTCGEPCTPDWSVTR